MARHTPFTIIIDTAESLPFSFDGLRTDSNHNNELWQVQTVKQCLGRYPDSWGDYSVIGGERRVAVERKSIHDLQSTLLGFTDGHRKRFEGELANLQTCESAMVVVEGTYINVLATAPEWGKRSKEQNAKILARSILALQQDYKVIWHFSGDRAMAEYDTFHWLKRWWEKDFDRRRKATREKEAEQRRKQQQLDAMRQRLRDRLSRDQLSRT